MTWATETLENMKRGTHRTPLVTKTLQLGLLDDWGEGWVRKSWTPKAELQHPDGTMFGGYIAALFDQTFAFATMTIIGEDEAFRTSSLNISFLSLSRHETVKLEAKIVARSRRLITLEAKMLGQRDQVRSLATAQQIVTRRPAPEDIEETA